MTPAKKKVSALIDHTALRPELTVPQIATLCAEARTHEFYAVCVNPRWLSFVVRELEGSKTLPITVVGFPLGAMLSESKAAETKHVIAAGAREVDMVIDMSAAREGDWSRVGEDIGAVVRAAGVVPVKVILETCFLNEAEIWEACRIAKDQGAAFVKTSTGFGPNGATIEHVRLMRNAVGPDLGVKASGGVKTLADFEAMVAAGATRIGTSSSVKILGEINS